MIEIPRGGKFSTIHSLHRIRHIFHEQNEQNEQNSSFALFFGVFRKQRVMNRIEQNSRFLKKGSAAAEIVRVQIQSGKTSGTGRFASIVRVFLKRLMTNSTWSQARPGAHSIHQ
jgi:hypothetical protein